VTPETPQLLPTPTTTKGNAMNALEIRYAFFKTLDDMDEVHELVLESPIPGKPVEMTVHTLDGRKFTVSVQAQ